MVSMVRFERGDIFFQGLEARSKQVIPKGGERPVHLLRPWVDHRVEKASQKKRCPLVLWSQSEPCIVFQRA
jgi:hypothetical protein